jgi:hypothetical protein
MVGVKAPATFQGRSLWTNIQRGVRWDDPAVIECAYDCKNPFRTDGRISPRLLGVRSSNFKLIMKMEPGAVEKIYDLAADPCELDKLDESASPIRKELLDAVRKHLEENSAGRPSDLRLRARLRDLRYQALETASSIKMNPRES